MIIPSYLLLLLLSAITVSLSEPIKLSKSYKHEVAVPGPIQFMYTIKGDEVHMAVIAPTKNWVGFGIGEPALGTMKGGDVVLLQQEGGQGTITDMYATAFKTPVKDEHQDYTLDSSATNDTSSAYEFTRKLDTKDGQDRAITDEEKIKLIFAHGTSDQLTYHAKNRWLTMEDMLPNDRGYNYEAPPPETDLQSYKIKVNNFKVPKKDTTYACLSGSLADLEGDHHMVQFKAYPGGPRVHHLVLIGCGNSPDAQKTHDDYKETKECGEMKGCQTALFGWAAGRSNSLSLPKEAGFPLGGKKGYASRYFVLQMHYDNPMELDNIVDNSAVEILYTKTLRKHDAGLLAFGDLSLNLAELPPKHTYLPFESVCPSQCTQTWPHPVQVFASGLHMHNTGSRIWTTVKRADGPLQEVHRIDYWDYQAPRSGNATRIQLNPGDQLNTHCVYDTSKRSTVTKFGESTQNEMCFSVLMYYPQMLDKKGLPWVACGYIKDDPSDDKLLETFCGSGADPEHNLIYGLPNNPPPPELRDPIGCHSLAFGRSGATSGPVCNQELMKETLTDDMRKALAPIAKPCEVFDCGVGTCKVVTESLYGSVCECPTGFSGVHCEQKTASLCASNPCKNGGTCKAVYGHEQCTCAGGYHGPTCEDSGLPSTSCNSKGMAFCMFNAKYASRCQQYDAYAACAKKHHCVDILHVWCGGMMYGDYPCATWKYCDDLHKQTKCNHDVYRQCYSDVQAKKLDHCAHAEEFLNCAMTSHCTDMTAYICQRKIDCPALKDACTKKVSFASSQEEPAVLSESFSTQVSMMSVSDQHWQKVDSTFGVRYHPQQSPSSLSPLAIAVVVVAVNAVTLAVVMAVLHKRGMFRSATDVSHALDYQTQQDETSDHL